MYIYVYEFDTCTNSNYKHYFLKNITKKWKGLGRTIKNDNTTLRNENN